MKFLTAKGYINPGQLKLSRGFSLVEIMVGMVMGLLAMIIIYQMFAMFEKQKRTTTGGDDAQNSAAIAMHTLRQEIDQSGYGITAYSILNCNISLGGVVLPLVPVRINPIEIPAGDANTDTLLIFSGSSNSVTQGVDITAMQAAGTIYTVQSANSFVLNDRVFAAPAICNNLVPLQMDRVAVAPAAGATTVTVQTGAVVTIPASLYNLGGSPRWLAYAVRNGNLTVCDFFRNNCSTPGSVNDPVVWELVANDIVSLRAQYGIDNTTLSRSQAQIDTIVNATTPPTPVPTYNVGSTWSPTISPALPVALTNCTWVRVPAVRFSLVARGQFEKEVVTAVAPTWDGSVASPINLSGNASWQNYRYKTFETVVPIMNITWMGVQANC